MDRRSAIENGGWPVKLPSRTVIEASAGTGKTFSLVTRLLRLIFSGVEPERIVALTFSRMAAGEIFNSFIERLSDAAADADTAAEESVRMGRELSTADFAAKLREVIARQHLSLIGTLDSFMMKVVRMIPFELGLEGEISVMSEYRSPVERMRIVGEMMMRQTPEAKSVFRQAFRLAFGTAGAKGFLGAFSDFIGSWHAKYRDFCEGKDPESAALAWGDASRIWGKCAPEGVPATIAEIRAMAANLQTYAGKRGADVFIDAVSKFGGKIPKLPKCLEKEPAALEVLGKMRAWKIGSSLEITRGTFLLMHAYEAVWAAKVRTRGLVLFDDLPRLLNSLPEGVRLPLEYRMDAKFDHWALDEFQDTSRGQWKALENLIGEAGSPDSGKSVLIVGDRKQSIYEWRGGDVAILGSEVERADRLVSLDESYRYVSVISDAVNRVFGEEAVRGEMDMDDAPESAKWKCRRHESHNGTTAGFVQVVQAAKAGRHPAISDFFEPVANALEAVKPWDRRISCAILVRNNSNGEAILGYLKSRGISKVVFEGESAVSDCPVLSTMADLVKLAEHAGDRLAYSHIKYSPIAEAMYPGGIPEPARLSAILLDEFTRYGMARKFREVREALKKVPDSWNDFTESRFEDFIRCAAEFEEIRDATMRLSDFIEFVSRKTKRDFAEPGMVRIMTVHQSKGLGFDWVIVPLYEPETMASERHMGPLEHSDPDWIMVHPGAAAVACNPVLAQAERVRRQGQVYNSLCLYYVAMTRAKFALTLILNPQNVNEPSSPERISDLIRRVGLETRGNPSWYESVPAKRRVADVAGRPQVVRAKRQVVRKSRPSESFRAGLRGDFLFSENFGKAARRGSAAHARYEEIEWLDSSGAANDFERALVKPSAGATLWRERAYELFVDGKWESGQFDRVVFEGTGSDRSAVIYDFKTDAKVAGETDSAFANRIRQEYLFQLESYRKALCALTGIPLERIDAVLLLEATSSAVKICENL